jgi:hypothetical protein
MLWKKCDLSSFGTRTQEWTESDKRKQGTNQRQWSEDIRPYQPWQSANESFANKYRFTAPVICENRPASDLSIHAWDSGIHGFDPRMTSNARSKNSSMTASRNPQTSCRKVDQSWAQADIPTAHQPQYGDLRKCHSLRYRGRDLSNAIAASNLSSDSHEVFGSLAKESRDIGWIGKQVDRYDQFSSKLYCFDRSEPRDLSHRAISPSLPGRSILFKQKFLTLTDVCWHIGPRETKWSTKHICGVFSHVI